LTKVIEIVQIRHNKCQITEVTMVNGSLT